MHLNRIELRNFRSYRQTSITFAARTYVVGPNNTGKSGLIDAIGFGLVGKCRGLEQGGIAELVRLHQPHGLSVRLDVQGVGRVERRTDDGLHVFLKLEERPGSTRSQQAELLTTLGISEAELLACLDTTAFLALHHSDAKAMIMGVLQVTIPAAPLEELGITGPLSLGELANHYRLTFANRTQSKNELEAAHVAPAPAGEQPPELAVLVQALAAVRATERNLLLQGAEGRGRVAALQDERAALQRDTDTMARRLTGYGDPHAELQRVTAALVAHRTGEPAAGEPLASVPAPPTAEAAEASTLRETLADARGRLRMITGTVGKIDAHDPARGCVIDSAIPCLTPARAFAGTLAAIRLQITALEQSTAAHQARLQELEAAAADRQRASEERDLQTRRLQALRAAALRAWTEQGQRLDAAIARSTTLIADLQRDQTRHLEMVDRCSAIDAEIATLRDAVREPDGLVEVRARITRGDRIIQEARSWFADRERHRLDLARTETLRQRVADLEYACAQLGPNGLIVAAIEGARVRFEGRVNRALDKFGYHLEFQIDPWVVRVNGRKSTQLSESERLRVGVALQLAIAEISGVHFVAIDRVDMLDSDNRKVLSEVIDGWPGQIVLAATKDASFVKPQDLPDGTAFYVLERREEITCVRAA